MQIIKKSFYTATAVILSTVMCLSAVTQPAAAAAGDPFGLDSMGLVFIAQGDPTQLYTAEQTDGAVVFTPGAAGPSIRYNAIGFNENDHYIYGIATPSSNVLVKVGQEGTIVEQTPITTLPVANYNQGTFGTGAYSDTLFVHAYANGTNNVIYGVDVKNNVATKYALNGEGLTNLSDIVWRDGYLWGFNGSNGRLYRININSGNVTSWTFASLGLNIPSGTPVNNPTYNSYGAQWVYGNTNIGLLNNDNGMVYQIALSNTSAAKPAVSLVSQIPGPGQSYNNDGTSYPGEPVDLSIIKTTNAVYERGGKITYTLTIRNNSDYPSSGYIVTDAIPADLAGADTTTSGCAIDSGVLTCAGGPLAAGASTVVTVTATAPTDVDAPCIDNTATVLGNEKDPIARNNESTATTCPRELSRAYTVEKTVSAIKANFGDTITYTVTIKNTGELDYDDVIPASFTDEFSAILDDAIYNDDATEGVYDPNTQVLSWQGPLAVGESKTITYSFTINDADNAGDLTMKNIVTPTGENGTCNPAKVCETLTNILVPVTPVEPPVIPVSPVTPNPLTAPSTGMFMQMFYMNVATQNATERRRYFVSK